MSEEDASDREDEIDLPEAEEARHKEKRLVELLEAVNQSSSTARTNWIFLLALMAYFFVTVASVTHKDLLLDNPVKLPLLNVEIALSRFFKYAPLGFIFVYLGVLLQHALLADKCRDLNTMFLAGEGAGQQFAERHHPARLNLSTFFLPQILAGRELPWVRGLFSRAIIWATLGVLPVVLLAFFQIAFLPYHDAQVTLWHKICVATAATLSIFLVGMLRPSPIVRLGVVVLLLATVGISALVVTVPGSWSDRILTSWETTRVEVPLGRTDTSKQTRYAFFLTAYLFEGEINYVTGEAASVWARNLIVPDATIARLDAGGASLAVRLRNRDLRFGNFDRSDLRSVDFTGADLKGASFRGADLKKAKFRCERRGQPPSFLKEWQRWSERGGTYSDDWYDAGTYAKPQTSTKAWEWLTIFVDDACTRAMKSTELSLEGCADLSDADLTSADLRGSELRKAVLERVTLAKADLRGMDLSEANACGAVFSSAKLDGTDLSKAVMVGAYLSNASLIGAKLRETNLTLATLQMSDLAGADLTSSWLHIADLRQADLTGADLSGAMLRAADLRDVTIWQTIPTRPDFLVLSNMASTQIKSPSVERFDSLRTNVQKIEDDQVKRNVTKVIDSIKLGDQAWTDNQERRQWETAKSTLDRAADKTFGGRRSKFLAAMSCHSERVAKLFLSRYGGFGGFSYFYGGGSIAIDESETAIFEDPRIVSKLKSMLSQRKGYDAGFDYVDTYFFDDWLSVTELYAALAANPCPAGAAVEKEFPGTLAALKLNAEADERRRAEWARKAKK